MVILESQIFRQFPEIVFGFSTKVGPGEPPFYFNLSLSVGDDEETVRKNRSDFFNALGVSGTVYQKQVHGNEIKYVDKPGYAGESDALITDKIGLGLIISAADCTSIYLYDFKQKVIAGVHAGWRGTQKNILKKTLNILFSDYKCTPETLTAYIAPAISQPVYEVGPEVASQFDEKYLKSSGEKYLLDVSAKNYDALIESGIPGTNLQYSSLCTFKMKDFLHSYRRDGLRAGRSIGIIAMKS